MQAAGRAKQRQCEHLQQQPSQLTRPQSAPAGGRRNLSVRCTESSAASSPKSPGRSPSFGQSSSRPSSAASGTSRSRQCWSPTQSSRHSRVSAPCSNQRTHKHGAGTWRATDSFADVSSTAIGACASPSSQQPLNKCSIDPWSPAVVAYEQQAVPPDNKPWQAANQLLLVGPEDEVVQKIAGKRMPLIGTCTGSADLGKKSSPFGPMLELMWQKPLHTCACTVTVCGSSAMGMRRALNIMSSLHDCHVQEQVSDMRTWPNSMIVVACRGNYLCFERTVAM